MDVEIGDDAIRIGDRFWLSLQRTLRVPDDGRSYPLPPGLGRFPTVAASGRDARLAGIDPGAAIIPMHQNEALWLGFDAAAWKPNAVKIASGTVNVLTGEQDGDELVADPQNYVVCPPQPWLDGINAGEAKVRQFVATPLGKMDTVEGQLAGVESGGIRVTVYDPKPGIFPDTPPPPDDRPQRMGTPMGLGAGGNVVQRIYPDPLGIETWDQSRWGRVTVHILNTAEFETVTGRSAPPSPISAATYTEHGLPWFALYDEVLGDIPAAERLADVRTLEERARERGNCGASEATELTIEDDQVVTLEPTDPGPPSRPAGPGRT